MKIGFIVRFDWPYYLHTNSNDVQLKLLQFHTVYSLAITNLRKAPKE